MRAAASGQGQRSAGSVGHRVILSGRPRGGGGVPGAFPRRDILRSKITSRSYTSVHANRGNVSLSRPTDNTHPPPPLAAPLGPAARGGVVSIHAPDPGTRARNRSAGGRPPPRPHRRPGTHAPGGPMVLRRARRDRHLEMGECPQPGSTSGLPSSNAGGRRGGFAASATAATRSRSGSRGRRQARLRIRPTPFPPIARSARRLAAARSRARLSGRAWSPSRPVSWGDGSWRWLGDPLRTSTTPPRRGNRLSKGRRGRWRPPSRRRTGSSPLPLSGSRGGGEVRVLRRNNLRDSFPPVR